MTGRPLERLTIEIPADFTPGNASLIRIIDDHGFEIKSVVELQLTLNAQGEAGISLLQVLGQDWLPLEDDGQPLTRPSGELVYDRRPYALAAIRVREPEKES